ncbi:hypothetical protein [Emticicia sp. BO119]|uniref:hypothetical protein n=1 Tax=Emticicia sp. BO119 TaxID=2757768 RepID=UPI0015F011F9|nr:hypothetical protein [Emticicia sp. BO119]MBA4853277.1 hypothetical protein [Emticicia sp. BO119]
MKSLFRIFNLTIIKEYYRQNAVFIFAVMLFAFGFLRAVEHITFIKNALKYSSLLGFIFVAWALHALKVILFTLRLLESKQNEFLFHARLFSLPKRFLAFCLLQFSLIQMTFLYSLAMIKFGIEDKRWWQVGYIIVFNIALILIGALFYEYRIRRPNSEQIRNKPIQKFISRFQTPAYFFFVRYLFSKQPVLLLLTKLFCCLVLTGICNLYPTDDYDERLLALGGLFVAAGHTVFCQQYFIFENRFLLITKNLPLGYYKRLLNYLLTYFILLLPEIVVLIRNLPDGTSYLFISFLLIFVLSLIFLNHHVQYINNISHDAFMQRLFFTGILFLVLIMFKIPVILMALINFLIAAFVFRKHYFLSEFNP